MVRAGHVYRRQKTTTAAPAIINTTSANAAGQEIFAAVEIERRGFSVGRFLFLPKKVPPPTPDGREGRLFPPEQSSKICQLLPELKRCRNKNLYKLYSPFRNSLVSPVTMSILRVIPVRSAKNFPTTCGRLRCAF